VRATTAELILGVSERFVAKHVVCGMTFADRRILVVEDEFPVSLTTIDLLESIGCEVVGPVTRLATLAQYDVERLGLSKYARGDNRWVLV
jgi:hypothetical protein